MRGLFQTGLIDTASFSVSTDFKKLDMSLYALKQNEDEDP